MKRRALLTPLLLAASAAHAQEQGVMNVIGRSVIAVAPDHVIVSVGVTTRNVTATAALDANTVAARRVIAFVKSSGVDERDIRTQSVTLSPSSRTSRDAQGNVTQESDGYIAGNTIEIRLKNIAGLGALMRDVVNNGANQISRVRFGIDNIDGAQDAARAQAVADAKRRAAGLADAAGVTLGPILRIDSPPRQEVRTIDGAADLPSPVRGRMDVPIEAGMIDVTAEVDVVWKLAPK